jgi:hypothetical protein
MTGKKARRNESETEKEREIWGERESNTAAGENGVG